MVRAFDFLAEKWRILGRKNGTPHSVIKIVTGNGRVRYGTVLWINSDSLLYQFKNGFYLVKIAIAPSTNLKMNDSSHF
jgi:hypothetical protein